MSFFLIQLSGSDRSKNKIRFILGSILLVLFFASTSQAQVQRTFVSGLGNDANPCSRTAPCRTFGAAIAQTNAGGEVYVLDSAGYGAFTINKSISIVAPQGVTAGISVFSGDGIGINAGANDAVILRGLTVNNQGSTGSGIVFSAGGLLHLEGCVLSGFSNNFGVEFFGPGKLEVKDSIMRGNDVGIAVASASGTAYAAIDHVLLEANVTAGLDVRDGSKVTIRNSVALNNFSGLRAGTFVANSSCELSIENCVASSNGGAGITAFNHAAGTTLIRISNSTVTDNSYGLAGTSGFILSRGNNTIEGNTIADTIGSIGSYTAQ